MGIGLHWNKDLIRGSDVLARKGSLTQISSESLTNAFTQRLRELGAQNQWGSAAELCNSFRSSNVQIEPDLLELMGDCYYRAAFQSESRDAFKKLLSIAAEHFRNASTSHPADLRSIALAARASFCKYWLTDDPSARRELIFDSCILPLSAALGQNSFTADGAKQYVHLLDYMLTGCQIASDKRQLLDLVKHAKRTGRLAFSGIKNSSDDLSFALIVNAYVSFLNWATGFFFEETESNEIGEELIPLLQKLQSMGELGGDKFVQCSVLESSAHIAIEFKGEIKDGTAILRKSLALAEETKDVLLIGRVLTFLVNALYWTALNCDVPEERRETLHELRSCAMRAIELLKVPLDAFDIALTYENLVQGLTELTRDSEKSLEKIDLLDEAIGLGKQGLSYASYAPLEFIEPRMTNVLRNRAKLATGASEKESLLSEAIREIDTFISRMKNLVELNSWNVAIAYWASGMAKADLAKESRKAEAVQSESMLREGVADLKKALELCQMSPSASGRETNMARICELLGDSGIALYEQSKERSDASTAIIAYEESATYYGKVGLTGYMAPVFWKAARELDRISSYEDSAKNFLKASEHYQMAAKNQKGLHLVFLDLSAYMQAWSKIEEARRYHREEKYHVASEQLRAASTALSETDSYNVLSKHYEAYSKAEEAEDLSRKENLDEAVMTFDMASKLFKESEVEIAAATGRGGKSFALSSIGDDIKQWIKISAMRARYCFGRMAIDQAKTLDKKGEAEASMQKYHSAAHEFRQLEQHGNDQDPSELDALAISCDAWAAMKEAEFSSSPQLYATAADLFLKAKEKKVRNSFVLSCLANSAICKAFEAGTRFKETSDPSLYVEIKKQLGVASRYYAEANLETAADWTRASESLFDALAYLSAAEVQIDPGKKNQMYQLAEKYLEISARRYTAIGYEKKKDEVLKHLKAVRENKELLISPLEALSEAPTASPSPVSFSQDHAVGLDHFEVANVTGTLNLSEKSVHFGSSVRLDLEFANVGKAPALLVRIEHLVPEGSFEFDAEKNPHRFQVSDEHVSIDLKGRRLEYLKSHEMSLFLLPKKKGTYEIRPRIVFVDELGKYKHFEFAPVTLDVKELGLMGWAKGKH